MEPQILEQNGFQDYEEVMEILELMANKKEDEAEVDEETETLNFE